MQGYYICVCIFCVFDVVEVDGLEREREREREREKKYHFVRMMIFFSVAKIDFRPLLLADPG